ncbi:MAG: T9SS type A sorting domain-containing protein [Chitinispirillales bacterium]|jgi:uncharacterized protein (TIGR02145 family)|nr:T9SS type A sorting domain-containing protein [Chitinispirillales bacterium]
MSKFKSLSKLARRGLAVISVAAVAFTTGVYAQEVDTAYVPFIVNVDATVKADKDGDTVTINVTANETSTLKIPLESTSSVIQRSRNTLNGAPVITSNQRGRVSINLPVQNYRIAEISLYSVNGRRILRTNTSASEATKNISRPNLVSGVYLLTVKGSNGHSFTNRLTHQGGGLNINAAFGGENVSPVSPITTLSRQAAVNTSGDWTITVSASGYVDSSYTLNVVEGMNPLQNITLSHLCDGFVDGTTREHYGRQKAQFCDRRDGTKYVYVNIGGYTWMAENLNYNAAGSWCYDDDPANCDLYGRLYDWATVMGLDASCNTEQCGDQVLNPHQGICPDGWQVPSVWYWYLLDWEYDSDASTQLRAQTGWEPRNGTLIDGTDTHGFSALPGGSRGSAVHQSPNAFVSVGTVGLWWSDDEVGRGIGAGWGMNSDLSTVYPFYPYKDTGLSLRCMKSFF